MLCYLCWTPLNKKGIKVKQFTIGYDGWITVEATNEDKAFEMANKILSKSNLTNDGKLGEWYITDSEEDN
jgi:hypothetical protein